jgi:hypothetical protein
VTDNPELHIFREIARKAGITFRPIFVKNSLRGEKIFSAQSSSLTNSLGALAGFSYRRMHIGRARLQWQEKHVNGPFIYSYCAYLS